MSGKFKGKALAVILVVVMLSISVSPMIFNNQMTHECTYDALQQYAEKHGKTDEPYQTGQEWYKFINTCRL